MEDKNENQDNPNLTNNKSIGTQYDEDDNKLYKDNPVLKILNN
jgi:hypothetical protein